MRVDGAAGYPWGAELPCTETAAGIDATARSPQRGSTQQPAARSGDRRNSPQPAAGIDATARSPQRGSTQQPAARSGDRRNSPRAEVSCIRQHHPGTALSGHAEGNVLSPSYTQTRRSLSHHRILHQVGVVAGGRSRAEVIRDRLSVRELGEVVLQDVPAPTRWTGRHERLSCDSYVGIKKCAGKCASQARGQPRQGPNFTNTIFVIVIKTG